MVSEEQNAGLRTCQVTVPRYPSPRATLNALITYNHIPRSHSPLPQNVVPSPSCSETTEVPLTILQQDVTQITQQEENLAKPVKLK